MDPVWRELSTPPASRHLTIDNQEQRFAATTLRHASRWRQVDPQFIRRWLILGELASGPFPCRASMFTPRFVLGKGSLIHGIDFSILKISLERSNPFHPRIADTSLQSSVCAMVIGRHFMRTRSPGNYIAFNRSRSPLVNPVDVAGPITRIIRARDGVGSPPWKSAGLRPVLEAYLLTELDDSPLPRNSACRSRL